MESRELDHKDRRFVPAYQLSEAARYLHVPRKTVWNWFRLDENPILRPAEEDQLYISFIGLMEAHVLSSMRDKHGVTLPRIRKALDYLSKSFDSAHPLIEFQFQTDGIDLFIDEIGSLMNVSRHGQTGMRDILELYLSRIERDEAGLPIRFFPFTQNVIATDPRIIAMDPNVSFGRPIIRRNGVTTSAIAERFKAGESIRSLALDFDAEPTEIEAAIRSEFELELAA